MRLIDSHAHLQADAFAADVPAVLTAARLSGVERLLVPGWDAASSEAAVGLVTREDQGDLAAAVGIHPHAAAGAAAADWDRISELSRDDRVVAIGETGLDFDRLFAPIDAQLGNLRRHLRLALETGKPAILHCRSTPGSREAQDVLMTELREAGFGGREAREAFGERPPGILHSFSGPIDYAEDALDIGLAISISGLAFRRGEEATRHVARLVPAGRLLVETDCPYLSPPGAPRRRNAPEWVRVTAEWVAAARGTDPQSVGESLVRTYDAVFVPRLVRRRAEG